MNEKYCTESVLFCHLAKYYDYIMRATRYYYLSSELYRDRARGPAPTGGGAYPDPNR